MLTFDGVLRSPAILTPAVAVQAHLEGYVEHDGGDQHVPLAGQLDKRLAVLGVDVRCVDNGEPAQLQPFVDDGVEQIEGGTGHPLVGFVVADQGPTPVTRNDLGLGEMAAGEGGLARTGGPAQHHQPDLGHLDPEPTVLGRLAGGGATVAAPGHRRNTASCVGWPTCSSSGPTPESAAV